MGTIKTTLKLETTSLPFPVNYSVSSTNVVNMSNYGRVTISDGENQILTNVPFGTEGGYIYAQSSATNTSGTVINLWLTVPTGEPQVQLASINPGEGILLPLSPIQSGVYATTNLGKTAVLDFYVADKGGKWGESTVMTFNNESTWKYINVDVNLSQITGKIDTGISTSQFYQNDWMVIQDKGYVFEFHNSGAGETKYVFIDTRGNIVDNTIPTNVSTGNFSTLDGKGFVKFYGDDQIAVFDGTNVYYHSFSGADSINIDNNYDNCTTDGSFVIYAYQYDGTTYSSTVDSAILINGASRILLSALDWDASETLYQYVNTYCYNFANFVVVETYNDDNGRELRYRIFDTTGKLLHDLDVSDYNMNIQELSFYGDNTVFFRLNSNNDLYDYMFNYNHELDRFIGKDMTWKDNYDGYYAVRTVRYNKEIGWSDSGELVGAYEPNGFAIIFYTDNNSAGWAYLDQYTENCRIHYLVEGMSSYEVYVPSNSIWFETSNIYATRTNVFIVWGDGNGLTATPIKLLALNSTPYTVQNIDTNSVTLLTDFEPYQIGNGHVGRFPAGNDYLVHYFNGQTTYTDKIVMAKKGLARTLSLASTNDWGYWQTGFGAFMMEVYTSSNTTNTNYYYNFNQNIFVNLNKWYDYIRSFPDNYGSFGPGDVTKYGNKILTFQTPGNMSGVNPSFRILTGSTITADIPLPVGNPGHNWGCRSGNDFFLWYYKNTNTGPWMINTYDNTGVLISTYNTGSTNWDYSTDAGSRMYDEFYIPGVGYQPTWISKKGTVISPDVDYDDYYMNDKNW
jgi:hypothetical protein